MNEVEPDSTVTTPHSEKISVKRWLDDVQEPQFSPSTTRNNSLRPYHPPLVAVCLEIQRDIRSHILNKWDRISRPRDLISDADLKHWISEVKLDSLFECPCVADSCCSIIFGYDRGYATAIYERYLRLLGLLLYLGQSRLIETFMAEGRDDKCWWDQEVPVSRFSRIYLEEASIRLPGNVPNLIASFTLFFPRENVHRGWTIEGLDEEVLKGTPVPMSILPSSEIGGNNTTCLSSSSLNDAKNEISPIATIVSVAPNDEMYSTDPRKRSKCSTDEERYLQHSNVHSFSFLGMIPENLKLSGPQSIPLCFFVSSEMAGDIADLLVRGMTLYAYYLVFLSYLQFYIIFISCLVELAFCSPSIFLNLQDGVSIRN